MDEWDLTTIVDDYECKESRTVVFIGDKLLFYLHDEFPFSCHTPLFDLSKLFGTAPLAE